MNLRWLLVMAYRDSRKNPGRLWLFILSIIFGVAALVALKSFSENLKFDIQNESKSLLGADLSITANTAFSSDVKLLMDSIPGDHADLVNFVSMALFPKTQDTKLVQVNALSGKYPYYGSFTTLPQQASDDFYLGKGVLCDQSLKLQYNLLVGDSLKLGNASFSIVGFLISAPGRAGLESAIAPLVYIPASSLENTGLLQKGSRITYSRFFKLPGSTDVSPQLSRWAPTFKLNNVQVETVENRKESLGRAFGNMSDFLNLIAFISLLLGCIGVGSGVHLYIKDKIGSIAVLRCLGVSAAQTFTIYLIQVVAMAILGSAIGIFLGSAIQVFLPVVLADFLPIQDASTNLSWSAVAQGLTVGIVFSVVFALIPLIAIRKISPLQTLRMAYEDENLPRDPLKMIFYVAILLLMFLFSWVQIGDLKLAAGFIVGTVAFFMLIAATAWALTTLLKKLRIQQFPFVVRQAMANMYRPDNQTFILMLVIGLGVMLITTLYNIQNLLLQQVSLAGSGAQPNTILFDIQASQKDDVAKLVREQGLPIIQEVPIVTMRLESIDGRTKLQADTTIPEWVFDREYRSSYRDTLIDTETIMEGTWHAAMPKDGQIYVSLSDRVSKPMKAVVGTRLVFNVQGVPIEAVVSSIRKVDFNRVQTNFFVVFPSGILEKAPQFFVVVSKTNNPTEAARLQRKVVGQFPNVSFIDLTQILKTAETILNKVTFVIRFMASFSILTGILVLIGSIFLSRRQRIKESILLRTLGASSRTVILINAIEYFLLGVTASLTGVILSMATTFVLSKWVFSVPFAIDLRATLLICVSLSILTMLLGWLGARGLLKKSPLEVLRTIN